MQRYTSLAFIAAMLLMSSQMAKGGIPRRALQQDWSSALASSSSTGSSATASAYSSGSGSAFASASSTTGSAATTLAQTAVGGNWLNNDGNGISQLDAQFAQPIQQQDQNSATYEDMLRNLGNTDNNVQTPIQGSQSLNTDVSQQPQLNTDNQQQQSSPSSTGTYTPSSSSGLSSYAQQSLDRHNLYRSRHRAPQLRWSSSLENDAQNWANRCVFEHAQGTGQGENIAWGYPDPVTVIDVYYDENKLYSYGQSQPGDWHSVGHFTQMVWVGSTDLGCAVASCDKGQLFHVCRYYSPGNVYGQYAENVLPPSS